jgi:signal transduction histidine kinase/signal recognition particle receptor subunit beta
MSLINVRDKTIQAKIVYYGTALSGKTTSLKHVHRVIDPDRRVELVSLNTEGDRTFFFDFLPIPLGAVAGYQVKLQAFTVPGQVKYNLTRRYVLRGADAVIFVADSSPQAFEDNLRSLATLGENLVANGLDPERTPLLLQYNKRDVPGAVAVERLREALNRRGAPEALTTATSGEGVFEAFSSICSAVTTALAREYRIGDPREASASVERRLDAMLARWQSHAEAEAAAAAENASAEGGLGAIEPMAQTSVIEVSSAAVPDIPDAETLLEHAVQTNIESARLVTELAETRRRLADHVRHLAALHATGVVLSSELDTDRLLDRVLAAALRTVEAELGSVLLVAPGGALRPKLVHGLADDPVACGAAGAADVLDRVLRRKPFAIELDPAEFASGPRPAPATALVAPLTHQNEVLGAVVAYVPDRPLDPDLRTRLRFLAAVASQAAVALVNARLYARVESLNRELERKVDERTRALAHALEDLQALDRLKDDFLASMSHELLTPLQSIGSAAEILATMASDDSPAAAADRAEFATVVQRESARLTGMLRTVLDFSQVEAGKVAFRSDDVDLRATVQASAERLSGEYRAAGARLRLVAGDEAPSARGDGPWIGRVVDELLSNAAKFGGGGEVEVTLRRDGAHAVLEVRDHGPGVAAGLRASIFEKFKQIGDVLTDKPSGLGLGLPMARLLVERMGGKVRYEAAPGGGSLFSLRLPLATTPQPAVVRA